jgi:hypothetical protein
MPLDLLFNPILKATTALGVPVPLAKAFFYAAGSSSTLQDTYADADQNSANVNPVVADSNGLFGPIFLLPLAYHLVIKDTTETITYYDQDDIAGSAFNAFFDDTFILKDNVDPTKQLQFQLSGLTTATTRTKTAADTNGILLDSLYGIMGAATFQLKAGSAITAANDITVPIDGNIFAISGNTQINRLSIPASFQTGTIIYLKFSGTPTVKHNQGAGSGFFPVLLNGSADFVAAANMLIALMQLDGAAWVEVPRRS